MTSRETKEQQRAGRPSVLAMITAAAASAAAFFVITKSGLAGTLVGAAVFSAVYHGASHWFGSTAERGAAWWLDRRGVAVGDLDRPVEEDSAEALFAPETERTTVIRSDRPEGVRMRRTLAVWGPLLLALAALGASGYSVVTGEPIERVIIHERVVEKPVVEERVVVQTETVTVTVTVPAKRDPAGNEAAVPAPTSTATTPTTLPLSSTTTSTTQPGGGSDGGTTTTSGPAPPSPSTTLPAILTTTTVAPGQ